MGDSNSKKELFEYCLRLGDDSLILGQRLGEWCGHAHVLEEDIALTNISLDLIGRARAFLSYAAEVEGTGRDEDVLAFRREAHEFKNCLITEIPNGDFGVTIVRQFLFDTYSYYLYSELQKSSDEQIAAIASKSLKEIIYHTRHSSEWIVRLGDGTEESHNRVQTAVDDIWRYVDDMFIMDDVDSILIASNIAVDLNKVKENWSAKVQEILTKATLRIPENIFMVKGGRKGKHTEHLSYILAEMQYLPRTYPDAKW
ncbi:MAG: phenylacetate-CoA oxygenase subunit PaaC [Bacteroidia bacterium]|nr:phenylacetate-CoA oxygenase subunit PaaC [Bacteroidia bacterium]